MPDKKKNISEPESKEGLVNRDREQDEQPLLKRQVDKASNQSEPNYSFPIVGIGGSAGALEAIELFFRNMPPGSGIAFVVVMHLDPTQKGFLPDIIQRFTQMEVNEITDGIKVEPDHVYVIPPNKDVSILNGNLLLLDPTQPRGFRKPIDHFLQSFARDQLGQAACIFFSGMGADGTAGVKTIVENYGAVIVQNPKTAAFDSMPVHAIKTDFADFVLPPEEMPACLVQFCSHSKEDKKNSPAEGKVQQHVLQKIIALIREKTGHDFSQYKYRTIQRRIKRRMNSHHIPAMVDYLHYMQENHHEVEVLFKELLIGVTMFFRDPEAFRVLQDYITPKLVKVKNPGDTIRVWVAGCSTSEEAFSLAILFLECLEKHHKSGTVTIQIFATDIDDDAILQARAGRYSENIASDITPELLQKYFIKTDGYYQVKNELREIVVFAMHNIHRDAPFTKLDLLSCRNLLIYLTAELQRKLIPVFHYALNPGGILFLGSSETISEFSDIFVTLDNKWKVSKRTGTSFPLSRMVDFPFSLTSSPQAIPAPGRPLQKNPSDNKKINKEYVLVTSVQKMLLGRFSPPAVIINRNGDIFYINGRTGRFLELPPGRASMNIYDMAREGQRYGIQMQVQQALSLKKPVVNERVETKSEAENYALKLTVTPLFEPEVVKGLLLVLFEEVVPIEEKKKGSAEKLSKKKRSEVNELEMELQYTRQRLQATIEETESSLEELKSTNEELQSANEELQSTNEEAMTDKEEMQSLNEELMTINLQYQLKADKLEQSNNDFKNLLDSTGIATIFLDSRQNIKNFSPQATKLFRLIGSDIGRPFKDIASRLAYGSLEQDVREVLQNLESKERTMQTTDKNEWYLMRILPYRTNDNFIDGAVITFNNITSVKQLEQDVAETRHLAQSIVDSVRPPPGSAGSGPAGSVCKQVVLPNVSGGAVADGRPGTLRSWKRPVGHPSEGN